MSKLLPVQRRFWDRIHVLLRVTLVCEVSLCQYRLGLQCVCRCGTHLQTVAATEIHTGLGGDMTGAPEASATLTLLAFCTLSLPLYFLHTI